MKLKLFDRNPEKKVFPVPLKVSVSVELAFVVLFWALGRVALVLHYGWTLEMVFFLDVWLIPLLGVVREVAKKTADNQDKANPPK